MGKDHLGVLCINGRILLKWNLKKLNVMMMTALKLEQDRFQKQVLVNTIVSPWVP
jgi:hypothetical protein